MGLLIPLSHLPIFPFSHFPIFPSSHTNKGAETQRLCSYIAGKYYSAAGAAMVQLEAFMR